MATGGDDNRILVLGELDALLPAFRRLLQEDCARPQEQAVRQRIEAEFGPQPPILVYLAEGGLVLVQPVPSTAIQHTHPGASSPAPRGGSWFPGAGREAVA